MLCAQPHPYASEVLHLWRVPERGQRISERRKESRMGMSESEQLLLHSCPPGTSGEGYGGRLNKKDVYLLFSFVSARQPENLLRGGISPYLQVFNFESTPDMKYQNMISIDYVVLGRHLKSWNEIFKCITIFCGLGDAECGVKCGIISSRGLNWPCGRRMRRQNEASLTQINI